MNRSAGGTHRYSARCRWQGSTGAGYDSYSRTHRLEAASVALDLSADAAFGGDAGLLNPEVLVVAAAASCQLLSFLAVAARSRIDVQRYEDEASGEMDGDDSPARITAVTLRPRIEVGPGTDEGRVLRCVERAHEECYIAHSLTAAIRIEPTVTVQAGES